MATTRAGPSNESVDVDIRKGSKLEDFERIDPRPPFFLTLPEVKLLGIAGVGFFLDAYDLFIINPVSTMLQYRLYGGHALPAALQGLLKASANIGAVIGQFGFGYLADAFGRKKIYGKELMVIIFATIMSLTVPTGSLSPNNCLIYLTVFRVILGIGVGGDYPMSASVSSDRASIRKRGTMLAYVFANQGWGSFMGSVAFILVLLCYKVPMNERLETSKVDGVWRIVIGLSLIPAFGTLYQRLTLGEAKRFTEAQTMVDDLDKQMPVRVEEKEVDDTAANDKPQISEFIHYFSEWRHAKVLIGTCMCWFLLDIAFYGVNLNQNVVLQEIGFDGKSGSTPWEKLIRLGIGSLIVTGLGFVPGYYVTVVTVEYLGRKKIQLMGFLMEALFLGILAGKFHSLGKVAFIINFALLQFFFNFGANTTTYMYPAEVFPTRFKAFAHGISAACGKAGAIVTALAFNILNQNFGTPLVLWILVGCCLGGFFFTLLLPEVRGRDPDIVYEEELIEERRQRK